MSSFINRAGWRKGVIALAAVGAVGLAGCTTAGGEGPAGAGVPYGATAAEWQAALADMEPVTLSIQDTAPSPDSPVAVAKVAAAWIEEMSGGKITVEITYANAVVPSNDTDLALADGRLDYGTLPAGPEPSIYPFSAVVLTDMTIFQPAAPITGVLIKGTALGEVANNTPAFFEEFEIQGIRPAFVDPGSTGPSGFMCTKPVTSLADFQGLQIRAGGITHAKVIEALGATPVTVPFLEAFEAAQRGLVDCIAGAFDFGVRYGWIEAAPYLIELPGASIATNTAVGLIGADVLALPLAAQQLVYDAQLQQMAHNWTTQFDYTDLLISADVEEFGGEVLQADPDVIAKINETNQAIAAAWDADPLLDDPNYSQKVLDSYEKWAGIIAELGFHDEGGVIDYAEWYTPGSLDFQPLLDRIYEEYYHLNRPGA